MEPSWRRLGANKSKIPIRKVGLDSPSQSNFPSRNFGAPLAHPFRNFDAPWLPKDCLIQPSLPEFRSLLAPTGLSNPTFLIGISDSLGSEMIILSNLPYRNFRTPWLTQICPIQLPLSEFRNPSALKGLSNPTFLIGISDLLLLLLPLLSSLSGNPVGAERL